MFRQPAFLLVAPLPFRTSRQPLTSQQTSSMSLSASRRVLVPIATGSEEIETAAVVDTLRRAGAQVTIASVESSLMVNMSRGMNFKADILIANAQPPYQLIALPGGMPGAERLRDNQQLTNLLKNNAENSRIIAAVCASPAVVLAPHGLLDGHEATCYPAKSFREQIKKEAHTDVVVANNGKLITATGPGTAIKWSLMLVQALYGKEKADTIAADMLVNRD